MQEFFDRVQEGFQVSPFMHQGAIRDHEDGSLVTWQYRIEPLYGWGSTGANQQSTAGWLAALPAFEPHWQVCMAMGRATGWLNWRGKQIEFTDAITYSEKNWGAAFPLKWFWIQCNAFSNLPHGSFLALTVGGGRRAIRLGGSESMEEVAMVGLHWNGVFIEFVPNRGTVTWQVDAWGRWSVQANNEQYEVSVEAHTPPGDEGTVLRAPTANGMKPFCRDSFRGIVTVELRQRYSGKILLSCNSSMAAVEVGGSPWWEAWYQSSRMDAVKSAIISLPLDLAALLPKSMQPPGL